MRDYFLVPKEMMEEVADGKNGLIALCGHAPVGLGLMIKSSGR